MIGRVTRCLGWGLAGCALLWFGAAQADEPPRALEDIVAELDRHDLSGCVVDAEGESVRKADVFLYYAHELDGFRDRFVGRTKTKRNGKFSFKRAVAWEPLSNPRRSRGERPKYVILGRHAEKGFGFTCQIEGDALDAVELVLFKASSCLVRVEDTEGNPVEGARVFLRSGAQPDELRKTASPENRYFRLSEDIGISSGATDASGRIRLRGPNRAGFRIEKDGYVAKYVRRNQYTLCPSARVSGAVTFEDSTPAPGMAVRFRYLTSDSIPCDETIFTDNEGRYAFANLAVAGSFSAADPEAKDDASGIGRIAVRDLRRGSPFVAEPVTFPIRAGEHVVRDITLDCGVLFGGTATDLASDTPAKHVTLSMLFPIPGVGWLESYALDTDENGEFKTWLPPGTVLWVDWDPPEKADYFIDPDWQRENENIFRGTVTEDMADLAFYVKLVPVHPLRGQVVDDKGVPVEKAEVYIAGVPVAKTDGSGQFLLPMAPANRDFSILALTEDKAMAEYMSLEAGANDVTIRVKPTRDYEGQVTTPDGLPAAGLSFHHDPPLASHNARQTITTDDDGGFAVVNLCPKMAYTVFWVADDEENRDYARGHLQVDLTKIPPGEPIRFEATQLVNALMGRVVGSEGDAIRDAEVKVVSRRSSGGSTAIRTDENGEFEVPRLAPGEVTLRIAADGHKPLRITTDSDRIDFEAVLRPASLHSQLAVTVVDQNGKPVPNALVVLRMDRNASSDSPQATLDKRADQTGRCQFEWDLAEDNAGRMGLLGCDHEGYTVAYRGVSLDEDGDLSLIIRKGGDPLSGKIVDDRGRPFEGATVRVKSMFQGNAEYIDSAEFGADGPHACTTDAEGRFKLTRFSAEDYITIAATAQGHSEETTWFNPARPQEEKTLTLSPAGELAGRVVLRDTGEPLSGIHMDFSGPGRNRHPRVTGEAGSFSVTGMRPGRYTLSLSQQDERTRRYVCRSPFAFTIRAGQTTRVDIDLEQGIPIRGAIISKATAQPCATVPSISARTNRLQRYYAEADSDGAWVLYLYPGEFNLSYYLPAQRQTTHFMSLTVEEGKTYEGFVIETGPSS